MEMFFIRLHVRFYISTFNSSLVNLEMYKKFRTAVMLFYIVQKLYCNKRCMFLNAQKTVSFRYVRHEWLHNVRTVRVAEKIWLACRGEGTLACETATCWRPFYFPIGAFYVCCLICFTVAFVHIAHRLLLTVDCGMKSVIRLVSCFHNLFLVLLVTELHCYVPRFLLREWHIVTGAQVVMPIGVKHHEYSRCVSADALGPAAQPIIKRAQYCDTGPKGAFCPLDSTSVNVLLHCSAATNVIVLFFTYLIIM